MNEESLSKIENRWLAASSGPWTVNDMRDRQGPAVLLTSARACARLVQGVTTKLEAIKLRCHQDAVDQGVGEEDYRKGLEGIAFSTDIGSFGGHFREMIPMPKHRQLEMQKKADASLGRDDGAEEPQPLFLISNSADPSDVEFVRCASNDVGSLIAEVRASWKKCDELRSALRDAREHSSEARSRYDALSKSVKDLRAVAARIAEMGDA